MASVLLDLDLTRQQVLDLGTIIEGHPDNIAPSVLGGFSVSMCQSLPTFESFDCQLPQFTRKIVHSTILQSNKSMKAVVCIPAFELATKDARLVMPKSYNTKDIIFNLSRLSTLTHALCSKDLDAELIRLAMGDKLHQIYRAPLVPGLERILELNSPGLLGICLSGAGPTCLAICNSKFDDIGSAMVNIFKDSGINSLFMVLDFDYDGYVVEKV